MSPFRIQFSPEVFPPVEGFHEIDSSKECKLWVAISDKNFSKAKKLVQKNSLNYNFSPNISVLSRSDVKISLIWLAASMNFESTLHMFRSSTVPIDINQTPNLVGLGETTPIWWLINHRVKGIGKLFFWYPQIDIRKCPSFGPLEGVTPLILAAKTEKFKTVLKILKYFPTLSIDESPKTGCHKGYSARWYISAYGDEAINCEMATRYPVADLNTGPQTGLDVGRTIHYELISKNYFKIIDLYNDNAVLSQNDVEIGPHFGDDRGKTIFWHFAKNKRWSNVLELLKLFKLQKPDTSPQNPKDPDFGCTPLWFAAKKGEVKVVNALVKLYPKLDPNAPHRKDRLSVFDYLFSRSNFDAIKQLLITKNWPDEDNNLMLIKAAGKYYADYHEIPGNFYSNRLRSLYEIASSLLLSPKSFEIDNLSGKDFDSLYGLFKWKTSIITLVGTNSICEKLLTLYFLRMHKTFQRSSLYYANQDRKVYELTSFFSPLKELILAKRVFFFCLLPLDVQKIIWFYIVKNHKDFSSVSNEILLKWMNHPALDVPKQAPTLGTRILSYF
jgi:hypothetical protein